MDYQFNDPALDTAYKQAVLDYESGKPGVTTFPLAATIIEAVYPDGCPENVLAIYFESIAGAGKDLTEAHMAYAAKAVKNNSGQQAVVAPEYAAAAIARLRAIEQAAADRRAAEAQVAQAAEGPEAAKAAEGSTLPLPTTQNPAAEPPLIGDRRVFGTLMNNIVAITADNRLVRKNNSGQPQQFTIAVGTKENGKWEPLPGFDPNTEVRLINRGSAGRTTVILDIAEGKYEGREFGIEKAEEAVSSSQKQEEAVSPKPKAESELPTPDFGLQTPDSQQDSHDTETPATATTTAPDADTEATATAEAEPATDAVAEAACEATHGVDVKVIPVEVEAPNKYPAKKQKK